jgi:hypothetical protein
MAAMFGMMSGCYNSAASQRALVDSPTRADGWVSGINCNNHGAVYYSFTANNREFRTRAPDATLDCRTAKRGDKLVIFYLASDPAVNTILDPREAYARAKGWYMPEWGWIIFMVLAFIALPIIESYRREKSKRASSDTGTDGQRPS